MTNEKCQALIYLYIKPLLMFFQQITKTSTLYCINNNIMTFSCWYKQYANNKLPKKLLLLF